MESLRKKQSRFAHMVANLILKAESLGYNVTLGDAFRSPEEAARLGKRNSLHTKRLAIDINLFDNRGHYLPQTSDHETLGKWWESQGGAWGGKFGDGNHYSLEHGGVR